MNRSVPSPSRRTLRVSVLALVVVLLVPSVVSAVTHEPVELQRGTVESAANGTTVIGVQGFTSLGPNGTRKPSRVVGAGPEGDLEWLYEPDTDVSWFYDVDPLDDGTVLIVGSGGGGTEVVKYDPATGQRVWTERLETDDTHDVDLINGDELLVADMRNYNDSAQRNDDRAFIYNRTRDEVVWEWYVRSEYDREAGGDYTDDWSHLNDADKIGEGRYMLSPRNMDEVVVVDRQSKAVVWRLGEDENHSVLYEQHNPTYLEDAKGRETVLVADSENDRVVEYVRENGTWNRTWELGTGGNLNWPRDADRLPNGNTLVTDSLNHRVMEVTPKGRVVWEYYAPWGTYEAERAAYGDEPGGPTIADQNATGSYALNGSAAITPGASDRRTFDDVISAAFAGTPLSGQADWLADRWAHIAPWIRPVWLDPWAFVAAGLAGLLVVGWVGAEVVVNRRAVAARLRGLAGPGRRGSEPAPETDADDTDD